MWNPEVLEPIVQCAHAAPVRSKAPVRQAVVCVEYLEGYMCMCLQHPPEQRDFTAEGLPSVLAHWLACPKHKAHRDALN